MSGEKYIGLDVHQATISVAVVDSQGKLIMESILETKGLTLLEFIAGLRGSLFVTAIVEVLGAEPLPFLQRRQGLFGASVLTTTTGHAPVLASIASAYIKSD